MRKDFHVRTVGTIRKVGVHVGRNAQCPCGCGHKFKSCPHRKVPEPRYRPVRRPEATVTPGPTGQIADVSTAMVSAGMPAEQVYAYGKVHVLVTDMNREALPPAAVLGWDQAITEYRANHAQAQDVVATPTGAAALSTTA